MTTRENSTDHRFGGDWTEQKLDVLRGYLSAYTKVLKRKRLKTGYIDAFAGSGSRSGRRQADDDPSQVELFPGLTKPDAQELLAGSARLALESKPRFDKYIFVEQDSNRCADLEGLRDEFPGLADDVDIKRGDANQLLQELCGRDWQRHRAVLFLDPYGLQVEWATLEAVAATRAIDMWLLFPLGIGVNRMLPRSGEVPETWRRRLDTLFGTPEWFDEFYRLESRPSLFDDDEVFLDKATMERMAGYFNDRLGSIFAGVAPQPGILRNSVNNPLYLLCFAVGNPRARKVALRIANSLLEDLA